MGLTKHQQRNIRKILKIFQDGLDKFPPDNRAKRTSYIRSHARRLKLTSKGTPRWHLWDALSRLR